MSDRRTNDPLTAKLVEERAANAAQPSRSVQRRVALQKGEPMPTFSDASGGALSDIIAWAKTKTPCASSYECLLADLMGLEIALAAHDQKVRREAIEEAAQACEQGNTGAFMEANIRRSFADRIRSLASGADEKP